ncbi:MAG: bifunctional glutamate N-acetyltransferase/amino-acid acetyltransferase ArgJ [Chloroflexi bacterium]|nr:bifunctional glutamate N-acetyltransferase/amino-acid acetyltransferase ArgJ [Chloroflexota bacterium]NOG65576.1 bifunctional glutamate N-acetyltransferase/amino-acid acetyltransferase ArgJ [Chloroflexota bacterium]
MGTLHPVGGFKVSGVYAGIRKTNKPDFTIVASDMDCTLAAVFTTNQVKAAPVLLDMQRLAENPTQIRAVITNAGNANACTGEPGLQNAIQTTELAAEMLGCLPEQVLVLSTGVIGVQLPMDKVAYGIENGIAELEEDAWSGAARSIMTTDTRPKGVSKQCGGYTITAIAKGSGMIAPNMATMLSMIATDAAVPQPLLQRALSAVSAKSFNRISVDGDTSTNDTVLLLANGASGTLITEAQGYTEFVAHLTELCTELSQMIVMDGEGATKFIAVHVTGATDDTSAYAVANTIAISPLVKTAFYGGDANWGRIMMAAGRAGVPLDQSKLNLWFAVGKDFSEGLQVVANGTPTDYSEAEASHIFAQQEITVHLDLGLGTSESTVWTCDFSHEYVSINGDYRT